MYTEERFISDALIEESLEEARAQEPVIEIIEDIDEETHGRIQEFHEILEEIKKRPDAEMKVAQVMGTVRILAGKTPEPRSMRDEADEEEDGSPLKQAPAPSAALKQIFRNFRDATVALVASPECPRDVRDAISGMLDYFGDFHIGGHTTDVRRARYILSCVFDLDDEEEAPAARNGHVPSEFIDALRLAFEKGLVLADGCVLRSGSDSSLYRTTEEDSDAVTRDVGRAESAARAARELAGAFATIEECRAYIPNSIYNGMVDLIQELHDDEWSSKPDVVRKALPHILRATIEREMADKEAA